jgi:DNA topoisomerase I
LIWRRFISCQMSNAIFDTVNVKISVGKHTFVATGKVKKFDGYTKVWTYSSASDALLPLITEGDEEKILNIDPQQHFTKPPPKYNDASFVKALEENGVGRPSTYATIIKTLLDRTYVEKEDKNLKPTQTGYDVSDFLVANFPELMDVGFTANMETDLDEIENGNKVWHDVLDVFWQGLKTRIAEAKATKKSESVTDFKCTLCDRPLAKRWSKWGEFYGCTGYNDKEDKCATIYTIGENGEPIMKEKKKVDYLEGAECSCGGKVVIRTNKKDGNQFGGCEKFPKCRNIFDMAGTLVPSTGKKKFGKKKFAKKTEKAPKKAAKKSSKKAKK